jgi:hypothetical protein
MRMRDCGELRRLATDRNRDAAGNVAIPETKDGGEGFRLRRRRNHASVKPDA